MMIGFLTVNPRKLGTVEVVLNFWNGLVTISIPGLVEEAKEA